MKLEYAVIGLITASLLSACGPSRPSYEERTALREEERQERIQQRQAELDRFAQEHNAISKDLLRLYATKTKYTASLQREIEGQVIAFKATLLDIQRSPDGFYEAVFGSEYFGATIIRLAISENMANRFLGSSEQLEEEVLVAARIDRITRNLLTAQACSEPECDTVSVRSSSFFVSYQATGSLIDIQQ